MWTTFNSFQWDLDYANPEVFVAMTEAMLALANVGVDVLRLDAAPFLWKRLGTNCQNQPEVHQLLPEALHHPGLHHQGLHRQVPHRARRRHRVHQHRGRHHHRHRRE